MITSVDPSRLLPSVALNGALQITVPCGEAFVDPGARASDPQDGNLTDEVQVSGTVDTGTPGTYTLDYTVADEDGNVSNVAQRTVVVVDNIPPRIVLYGPETLQVACGDVYDDPGAFAEDVCDSAVSIEVDASAVDMATPGTYTVRYIGVDGSGNTGTVTRTVVVADTTAPVITGTGLEDVRYVCGRVAEPVVSAADGCDGPVSVTVGGAVDINVPGTYTQTFTATDAAGNEAVAARTVTIILAGAPTITLMGEADLTLECGDSFLDPGAVGTDACDRPLTVNISGDIPTPLRVGTYERRYYGRDENDLFASATRTVTVVDTRPPDIRLKGLRTIRLECGDTFVDPGATALDDCTGPAAVAVSGNLNTRRAGAYTLTYTAEDQNGNEGIATREIIVSDTTAPAISLRGAATVEVACGGDWVDPGASASDSCGGPVTVTQTPESVDLNTPGTSTITYTAEDASGNRASVTRMVAVLPCEVPEGEGAVEGMTDPDVEDWATRLIDRFDDRDANGDGQLTFEEIVAGEQGFTRDVFDLLDTDGSGALTEGELRAQIAPDPPATGCACMDNAEKTFRSVAGDLLLFLISLSIAVLIGRVGRSEG
jgi:hypothetical protein